MGNHYIENKENETEKTYITATKTIDGRLFSIRVFFPDANASSIVQTSQQPVLGNQ